MAAVPSAGLPPTEQRRAARAALCIALLVTAGCASRTRAMEIDTVDELPDDPRHAPGVAVDPAPELPAPLGSAYSENGIVVLRAPLPTDAAREVVREFFRAAVDEAPERLDQLVLEQAWIQTGAQASRQPARSFWRVRLTRLDYRSLAGQLLYRESEVETYRADDIARLSATRALPVTVGSEDVLVRVPLTGGRSGRIKLFAEEVLFVLRPQADGFKIAEIFEEFQLP
jgi:hypothetical protein